MSRSGYIDYFDDVLLHHQWRSAVRSAIRGKRGQAFLREMLEALDDLPQKRLISSELQRQEEVCAIGAVGRARGVPMSHIDPENHERIATTFGIANALAREIMWINDEAAFDPETPEQRYERVRKWVVEHLRSD